MAAHVTAILLGRAQDAGVPQAGCGCPRCAAAWADPARSARPACLGLVDRAEGRAWLIDATPALPSQLRELLAEPNGLDPTAGEAGAVGAGLALAGIVLTHAHIGHYTGLMYLGREAMGARGVPVYASASMAAFVRSNAPWRQLVELGNIELRPLTPGVDVALSERLTLTPLAVPHRAEWSDTLAFVVAGTVRRLLWCPDIDAWDDVPGGLARLLADHRIDVACLDATFFDAGELGGRDMREVPHPLAVETVARLGDARAAGWDGEACLVHLNHTNPLLDAAGAARAFASAHGLAVGIEGWRWAL